MKAFGFGIAVSLLVLAQAATLKADDLTVCATVWPCDEKTGELLSAFSDPKGECYEIYASQCKTFQASLLSSKVAEELNTCEKANAKYIKQIRKLKKQLKNKSR